MKADLPSSQFDTLDETEGVLAIEFPQEPAAIVDQIKRQLGLS